MVERCCVLGCTVHKTKNSELSFYLIVIVLRRKCFVLSSGNLLHIMAERTVACYTGFVVFFCRPLLLARLHIL